MNSTRNSGGSEPVVPIITGPTGAGKSALAYRVSDCCPGFELISADSRQIYKYLNIGTDKPSPDNIEKYKIHLVDFVEPGRRFTAFDFVAQAKRSIQEIFSRGGRALICGGTGLYIKSLVEGIVELPDGDFTIRDNLEREAIEKGSKYLFERLQQIDPPEAIKTHPNNIKRVIRALEIYYLTGRPKSEILAASAREKGLYNFKVICFLPPREKLYEQINQRVRQMLSD
ncbi:MAG: tRNA (adenosine(37)-N6)-dimethylallyltransferase MiaA, partial [Candidatus Zixiibacteriota bacterium]